MRALLSAVGTRGDIQPILALALQVRALGHQVRLCVSPNFVAWAERLGFEAVAMGVEMRPPRRGAAPPSPEELRKLAAAMPDLITDQFETLERAVEGCDVIVGGNAHQYAAPSIAALRGIPFVAAVYAPVALPAPSLAPPAPPGQPWIVEGAAEIAQAWAATRAQWNVRARERVDANRARLGMDPIEDVLDHVLGPRPWLAADPVLGPAPATPDREVLQTGAWLLPEGDPLPPRLDAFLAAGDPPVFVGFGSMPAVDEAARVAVRAARGLGRRVVLSRGWAELEADERDPDLFAVEDVAFERLFPRVAAVVHHGGAGTTTTAALAGVPQVVTPMFSDQPWGRRVESLGAGAVPARVDEAGVRAALERALAPDTRERARDLAHRIVTDGAARAARELVAG